MSTKDLLAMAQITLDNTLELCHDLDDTTQAADIAMGLGEAWAYIRLAEKELGNANKQKSASAGTDTDKDN